MFAAFVRGQFHAIDDATRRVERRMYAPFGPGSPRRRNACSIQHSHVVGHIGTRYRLYSHGEQRGQRARQECLCTSKTAEHGHVGDVAVPPRCQPCCSRPKREIAHCVGKRQPQQVRCRFERTTATKAKFVLRHLVEIGRKPTQDVIPGGIDEHGLFGARHVPNWLISIDMSRYVSVYGVRGRLSIPKASFQRPASHTNR